MIRKFILLAALAAQPAFAARTPAERLQSAVAAYDVGDFRVARKNFKLLADEGSAIGETMLGVIYAEGRGVKSDPATAVAYYYRAANRGYAPAQLALSRAFADGAGASKDVPQAYLWARLAAARGVGDLAQAATTAAARLSRSLAPDQRKKVDAAVRNWRPWASNAR